MILVPTPLSGAYVMDLTRIEDDRGFFARSFCQQEFVDKGLNPRVAQCNISFNRRRGTLRGMHFQVKPYEEAKVVRCTRGAIWDVIVDLRADSPTLHRWHGVELSAESRRSLYIPEGFGHGFQTLTEDVEVLYLMSEFYRPDAGRGLRWDDPKLAICWPLPDPIVSAKDQSYPLLV